MSNRFNELFWALCLAAGGPMATAGQGSVAAPVRPSDCKPRDADSTCATAVAGAPVSPPFKSALKLYEGPLGGVPAFGYAYWGFDFFANQTGTISPVRSDEFINRSNVPVTITLSFNFPADRPCNKDCLPGVQFQVDAGWFKLDPPYVLKGDVVSVAQTFDPGRGYGWVIGLWLSTNPKLTVTIPPGSTATLQEVGLPMFPAIATEIAATQTQCACWDGTSATCSEGTRFSNGLLGAWYQNWDNYQRAAAFNSCPPER
jgi:hypothetical protein